MVKPERPSFVKVPCGQVLGHGEYCIKGHMCDQCTYIRQLEIYIDSIRDEILQQSSRFLG